MFQMKKVSLLALAAMAALPAAVVVGAQPAGAAVPGLQLVSAESAWDSTFAKSVTVYCPAGKLVVGAGGEIHITGMGQAALEDVTPLPSLTGVNVVGTELAFGTGLNWYVKAYAICANPLPGQQLVSAETPLNSVSKGLVVTCPAGKKVVGVGGQVNVGQSGWVALQRLKIESPTTVRVRGSEVGFPGEGANWSVKGYAICANPLPGYQIISGTTPNNSQDVRTLYKSCPAGKKVIGAGGDVENEDQRAVLDEITPVPNLAGVNTVASESLGGTVHNWVSRTFVVCATA